MAFRDPTDILDVDWPLLCRWRGIDQHHRRAGIESGFQFFGGIDLDNRNAEHTRGVIVHVTRCARHDHFVLQSLKIGKALHLFGIGTRDASRGGVGNGSSAASGDDAPLRMGNFRKALADGFHQFIHLNVMA